MIKYNIENKNCKGGKMKKIVILAIVIYFVLHTIFAQKILYQNIKISEEVYGNQINEKFYNLYSSINSSKIDALDKNQLTYTNLMFFNNYPKILIILIDHKNKSYTKKEQDINELINNTNQVLSNPTLSEILKNLQISQTSTQTQVNQKNINAINYKISFQQIKLMDITIAHKNQIFSEEDLKNYNTITNSNSYKVFDLFQKVPFLQEINQKIKDGYIIIEISSEYAKYKQKLETIKIVEESEILFSIPNDYKEIN